MFGQSIARNFLHETTLSGRFFTLMVFLHIAIPLLRLLLMWIHIQRITEARTKPPRGLAAIALAALVAGSLILPAPLGQAADLTAVPMRVGIDWFLLSLYPVIESVPAGAIWAGVPKKSKVAVCDEPSRSPRRASTSLRRRAFTASMIARGEVSSRST
jgi:hypothetical protein